MKARLSCANLIFLISLIVKLLQITKANAESIILINISAWSRRSSNSSIFPGPCYWIDVFEALIYLEKIITCPFKTTGLSGLSTFRYVSILVSVKSISYTKSRHNKNLFILRLKRSPPPPMDELASTIQNIICRVLVIGFYRGTA